MLKRHEIKLLRTAGHTQPQIQDITGVSERSVRRIQDEPPPPDLEDAREASRRGIGRPNQTLRFESFVLETLKAEPRLKSIELVRRAKIAGYTGKKTQFFEMVRRLRPKDQRPLVRFEGLAGEFIQHDFGQTWVTYQNGEREKIQFFGSRLKFSRYVQVTIVPNQQTETLVRACCEHFEAFGGIPLVSVFDRPTTIVKKWKKSGEVTEWNQTFQQFFLELGLGVELCWPARGQEKGSVENLVGWVKGSFFKQRRFHDHNDLIAQLAQWHQEVNHERACRATNRIPSELLDEERCRFRTLKVLPKDLVLRFPVQVGPTGFVTFQGNHYSMPPDAINIAGTLFLGRDAVRITAGRHEASHPRLIGSDKRSSLRAHQHAMVARVSGKRGRRYLKREQILALGAEAHEFLTEVVHRRPKSWWDDVDQLHGLIDLHEGELVLGAMKECLIRGIYGAEYVAAILRERPSGHTSLEAWA